MENKEYIEDLKVMIGADKKHLAKNVEAGNRVVARQLADALVDNQRELAQRQGR
jgi:hypothetical protein